MKRQKKRKVEFSVPVRVEWDGGRNRFRVLEQFSARWRRHHITVPVGFLTDFASIPRLFRSLIPQMDDHIQPAVVHDYAYAGKTRLTRYKADKLFLDAMADEGVGWAKRWAMFSAVRAAGWLSWRGRK